MPKQPKRVLIVEDDTPMAEAIELKISRAGFLTHVAMNGLEALEALNGQHFDLMILDLVMPRMDGFEVLRKMKATKKLLPTIILTNLSHTQDMQEAKKYGVKDFFIKSNTPLATLVAHVQKLLRS